MGSESFGKLEWTKKKNMNDRTGHLKAVSHKERKKLNGIRDYEKDRCLPHLIFIHI